MYCPRCGVNLVKRNGPYGEFYGCSNYPECTYTLDIDYDDYDDLKPKRNNPNNKKICPNCGGKMHKLTRSCPWCDYKF